jgi:hypothetical protein
MKSNEFYNNLKSEENEIYNGLIKCINNILDERGSEIFIDEGDFHLCLCMELKKYFININSSLQIIIEYNCLNYDLENKDLVKNNETIRKSFEIDIVLLINNNHYLVEIKYSAYKGKEYYKGTDKYTIINSEEKEGSYKSDIKKIRNLVNKNISVICGYCVLLTTSDINNDFYSLCKNDLRVELCNTRNIYTYYIKKITRENNCVRPYCT